MGFHQATLHMSNGELGMILISSCYLGMDLLQVLVDYQIEQNLDRLR